MFGKNFGKVCAGICLAASLSFAMPGLASADTQTKATKTECKGTCGTANKTAKQAKINESNKATCKSDSVSCKTSLKNNKLNCGTACKQTPAATNKANTQTTKVSKEATKNN